MAEVSSGEVLHLRLFLEGVEIPVISANVTSAVGSPGSAQIEIVPTDRALNFLARTTVHLFYLDSREAKHLPDAAAKENEKWKASMAEKGKPTKGDEKDHFYKLLFCGELFSYSYVKSGFGQRSVMLQCLDFSNTWDTSYLYSLRFQNVDPGDGQGTAFAGNQANFVGTREDLFSDVVQYPEMVISDIAASRRVANTPGLENSNDIIGGLFSILEVVGGVHGKWFGINAWSTIQERRVRLIDQLIGDSGETATKLYEQSVFEQWLLQRVGGQGAVMSFRDLIAMINGFIYYDVVPMPAGRYLPGDNSVPNWGIIDSAQFEAGLIGRIAGIVSPESLALAAVETGAVQLVTSSRAYGDPGFLEKLNELERILVEEKGWNGQGKPLPRETSIFRSDSKGYHGVGHAADFGLAGNFFYGFTGKLLYASAYDDRVIAEQSPYGRLHWNLKNKNSPDKFDISGDEADMQTTIAFFKDLKAVAESLGLTSGSDFGIGTRAVDDVNEIVYYPGHATWIDGKPYFREYVYTHLGFGWDPIHVQSSIDIDTIRAGRAAPARPASLPTAEEQDVVDETAVVLAEAVEPPTVVEIPTLPFEDRTGETVLDDRLDAEDLYSMGSLFPFIFDESATASWNREDGVTASSEPVTAGVDEGKEVPVREKLITQIFRPDIWFASPPICNVIFPEEYVSFTFNRQMMRETTRLQLTTFHFLMEDAILNQYYFAPQLYGEDNLAEGGIGSASKALIYAHEKFSGIIPKMERISEVSFYANSAPGGRSAFTQTLGGGDGTTTSSSSTSEGGQVLDRAKISDSEPLNLIERYAAQVAAYNFLRERYSARSASLTGRFLPRLVAGFPMLIVNRVGARGEVTHFLGMVNSLNHTVSQGGGNTSVSVSHARSHRAESDTDDLFSEGVKLSLQTEEGAENQITISVSSEKNLPMSLDDFLWAKRVQRAVDDESTRGGASELLETIDVPEVDAGILGAIPGETLEVDPDEVAVINVDGGDLYGSSVSSGTVIDVSIKKWVGPNGGAITAIKIDDNDVEEGQNKFTSGFGYTSEEFSDQDPTPITIGQSVVEEYQFSVKRFTLVESFPSAKLIPLEEAIRPPWISDEYSNVNIGKKIYSKFFGCRALVDITDTPDENYALVSIEKASNDLVASYKRFAESSSADGFIYGATRRGHATLPQVLESFHAEAFGNKTGLSGLDIVGLSLVLPFGDDLKQEILSNEAEKLDPRKERRARVDAYLSELKNSLGLRG